MINKSKRYQQIKSQISKKSYEPREGIELMKTIANARFAETAEVHINLAIDPKYNDQQLRASVLLPNGTGKSIKIAVITNPSQLEIAKSAGADLVGSDEILDTIINNNSLDFNYLIATPDFVPKMAKFGKILGPKGLMPSPKTGTVTNDLANTIKNFKNGKIEYRADKTGIVHIGFGRVDFSTEDLLSNLLAIKDSINKNKPSGVKGKYWKSCYICSTMSPSISIDVNTLI
uniref:ribosomal protein L1 n=1 Tax=Galdieria phlegrea TaxID=1389228 RepID=UPI0023D8A0B9|nr:ribosomal protein L1 [Galdieria phlegrea]UNJ16262.1 ribosomal protein L1 [Galdieria sp.]WDA99686.1 ribosomal protein L1 [Galdieria sulphuraria]WDA99878.1 ribosomal protein L1 [Galdieria phlegrea]